jgi:hypothetical protein
VADLSDNIEERINLQKALLELEDLNVSNKYELRALGEFLLGGWRAGRGEGGGGGGGPWPSHGPAAGMRCARHACARVHAAVAAPPAGRGVQCCCHLIRCPRRVMRQQAHGRRAPAPPAPPPAGQCSGFDRAEALERQAVLQEAVRDNEEAAANVAEDVAANEAARREVQARIDAAVDQHRGGAFLKVLGTFRLQVGAGRLPRPDAAPPGTTSQNSSPHLSKRPPPSPHVFPPSRRCACRSSSFRWRCGTRSSPSSATWWGRL